MASTLTPTPKLQTAGVVGAVTALVVWVVSAATGLDPGVEVGAAIGVVLTWVAGYLQRDRTSPPPPPPPAAAVDPQGF